MYRIAPWGGVKPRLAVSVGAEGHRQHQYTTAPAVGQLSGCCNVFACHITAIPQWLHSGWPDVQVFVALLESPFMEKQVVGTDLRQFPAAEFTTNRPFQSLILQFFLLAGQLINVTWFCKFIIDRWKVKICTQFSHWSRRCSEAVSSMA